MLLASLLKAYAAERKLNIIAGIKIRKGSIRFDEYHKKAVSLYGDFASFSYNHSRSENFTAALNANVIIGSYSTLLREVFSFGKKIYPINFGPSDLSCHYESLQINSHPSQGEFNLTLDALLNEDQNDYERRMSRQISHIGAFPQDLNPINRLAAIIDHKLKIPTKRQGAQITNSPYFYHSAKN